MIDQDRSSVKVSAAKYPWGFSSLSGKVRLSLNVNPVKSSPIVFCGDAVWTLVKNKANCKLSELETNSVCYYA